MNKHCTWALALLLGILGLARPGFSQLAAPCQGAPCGTTIGPGLINNQVWTKAKSPYCVTGDIQIALLTIQPGVCIQMDADVEIQVLTGLTAIGTEADPIYFTAKDPTQRWKGLLFQNVLDSTLEWCQIEYANTSAIRLFDSIPVIRHCTFVNNAKSGSGGALRIDATSKNITLVGCTIKSNTATGHGGGIYASLTGGSLTLRQCIVSDNVSNPSAANGSYTGGGVYVSGECSMLNTVIARNTVRAKANGTSGRDATGGGVSVAGILNLVNCDIRENLAQAYDNPYDGRAWGGGVSVSGSTLSMTNSTIGGNTVSGQSGNYGSNLYSVANDLNAMNCTFAKGNVAGIYLGSGTALFQNSIIYLNNNNGTQVVGTATMEYCDIQGGWAGSGANNFDIHPVFRGIGNSASDLRIAFGSPCTDMGDPNPMYDDVCFPPSLGSNRNDVGAHGGPGACGWVDANAIAGWLPYCTASANSTGSGAHMWASGSTSIAANDLVLEATGCPPGVVGLFFYGRSQQKTTLGNGNLCLTGSVKRLVPAGFTSSSGFASRAVDYTALPPGGGILAGDFVNFQFWYRDPSGGGAGFNLSDGLEVFFTP